MNLYQEEEEDEENHRSVAIVKLLAQMEREDNAGSSQAGGSVVGRQTVERERQAGDDRLFRDYFADAPVYGPRYFRWRY